MRVRMLVALAAVLAIALPAQAQAQAGSGGFAGIVLAKQSRGMLVLSGAGGTGLSVHAAGARARVGDRISFQGLRLRDGTVRATQLRVLAHMQRATVRGVVVRQLRRSTLVATGRSVITIHHAARQAASASDHGGLRAGTIAEFRVRIEEEELEEVAVVPVGQAANVRIEGRVVSVSPLVVSVEGLPITITVPAGMTLPAALSAGDRIELTVTAAAGNVFTLVAINEIENEVENVNPVAPQQEVEVKGSVVSSTASQIVVRSGGTMFTFAAPAGVTLPVLPAGTFVRRAASRSTACSPSRD